ncbi:MAG TPA: PPOX class F420-dependent oxidoreductase [Acidimicrobiales bacterium]|nr:PPOX class F420-dependent oxidoreductase [Acidimicrobiales bacterium]
MPTVARDTPIGRDELLAFIRPRHRLVLGTFRRDGRVQLSPVTGGVDAEGRIVVSSYPERAKSKNLRRDPRATVLFLSDDFGDEWVQVDGTGEVLDLPDALEPLCDYYRSISGEHPDWDEYRGAMVRQGKVLLRIAIEDWGPVSRGGFPARLLDD